MKKADGIIKAGLLVPRFFQSLGLFPRRYQISEEVSSVFIAFLKIVRVQYFVRGGFVGHRSRVSSKHLSLIFRSTGFDSSGVKKGLRCTCKMHVWVSDPQRNRPLSMLMFGEATLQLSPSLIELFR
ncbi:hypothetical protein TNCV_3122691 [Trichonephila clavipes]|nr:hypothetical protein TNCV_3122691 [Trichonephila clavipes]